MVIISEKSLKIFCNFKNLINNNIMDLIIILKQEHKELLEQIKK